MAEIRRSHWEHLHRDVIESILDRLVVVSDLIRFGAVCKSWNCLCLNYYKEKRILGINHQLPWLAIQPAKESPEIFSWPWLRNKECTEIHNMYDLTCSKVTRLQCGVDHNMHSLRYYHRYYVGCSHGWWFVLGNFHINFFGFALQMYNPISGAVITLPPFIESISMIKNYRVTLSRDPSACLTSPFEVLMAPTTSNGSNGYLVAHWKSGDDFWTYSNESNKDDECYCRFDDCIFYKDRMLGISTHIPRDSVDVISINIGDGFGGISIKKIASTSRLEDLYCTEAYLVETTKGELLMVRRYTTRMDPKVLRAFKVYKLIICSDDSVKIIPTKNLDGDALFLGKYTHSISVLASNYPACLPNSIYHTSYLHRLQVYNVEDGRASICLLHTGYKKIPFVSWTVPSMKL